MIADLLGDLLGAAPLPDRQVRATFERLVDPATSDPERAAVLVALAARAPRIGELVAFARAMRRRAAPFPVPPGGGVTDLCGTGGAPRPTFNVSTVSAFVVAAAGAPVVKHGNRSARGPCGSSDLLEALGLPVTSSRALGPATYRAHRLAFLHAPLYHASAAAVAPVRQLLGLPTVFNRIGPWSNPCRVRFQVVGAPDPATAELFAGMFGRLGVRRGISMASEEGCDEFSPRRPTVAFVWNGSTARRRTVRPEAYLDSDERRGPWGPLPPPAAAEEAERLLAGGGGARRGSVLLTSGAALWVAGRSAGLDGGIALAREALDGGAAEELLVALRDLGRRYRRGDG